MIRLSTARALLAAMLGSALASVALAAADKHDLSGPWIVEKPVPALLTLDGLVPPLRAEATVRYMLIKEAKTSGSDKYDGIGRCAPLGVPRLSLQPFPWTIVADGQQLQFNYEWNNTQRAIYMDEAPHGNAGPSHMGQSVGKWQGNTLVVNTTRFNSQTLLDDSGLPHSDALQITERYRLTKGGKILELTLTVTDAQSYLKAWESRVSFIKVPDRQIRTDDCLKRVGAIG